MTGTLRHLPLTDASMTNDKQDGSLIFAIVISRCRITCKKSLLHCRVWNVAAPLLHKDVCDCGVRPRRSVPVHWWGDLHDQRATIRSYLGLLDEVHDRDNPGVCVQLRAANVLESIKDHPQSFVLHHLDLSDVCCHCVPANGSCIGHRRTDYRLVQTQLVLVSLTRDAGVTKASLRETRTLADISPSESGVKKDTKVLDFCPPECRTTKHGDDATIGHPDFDSLVETDPRATRQNMPSPKI